MAQGRTSWLSHQLALLGKNPTIQKAADAIVFALVLVVIVFGWTMVAVEKMVFPDYGHVHTGKATWYRAAHGMTCATRLYRRDTLVRVTYGGRSVVVRVVEAGPSRYWFKRGRIIDLSREAFIYLCGRDRGPIDVVVEPY